MAQYNAIKAAVNAYIKANGRKEITGQILNSVLNATIDSLGRFFQFAGEAYPSTDPGTPDQNVTYLAGTAGTYTDFGGITLDPQEIALLMWDGEWHKHTMLIGIQEVVASVDDQVGTPSVDVNYANGHLDLAFHNVKGIQGNTGAAAGFGVVSADVDAFEGTPGVSVDTSGDNTAKNFTFHFTNLKGKPGVTSVVASVDGNVGVPYVDATLSGQVLTLAFHNMKGQQGDTGSSVSYPFTLVNNVATDDATQGLSAAMGVYLQEEINLVNGGVTKLDTAVNPGKKYIDISTRQKKIQGYATSSGEFRGIGTAGQRFVYIPVVGGTKYRLVGNYNIGAATYSNILFSATMPETGDFGVVLDSLKGNGDPFDILYTAPSDGYIFIWAKNASVYYDSFFLDTDHSNLDLLADVDTRIKESISYSETTKEMTEIYSVKGYVLSTGEFTKIGDSSSTITMRYFRVSKGVKCRIYGTHANNSSYGSVIFSESFPVSTDFGLILKMSVANATFDETYTPDFDGYIFIYASSFTAEYTEPDKKMLTKGELFADCIAENVPIVGVAYQQKYIYVPTHKVYDASTNGSYVIPVLAGEKYLVRGCVNAFANYAIVGFTTDLTNGYDGAVVLKSVGANTSDYEYEYLFAAPMNGYLVVWSNTSSYGNSNFVEILRLKYRQREIFDHYLPDSLKVQTFGDSITDCYWGDMSSWVSYIPDNIKNTSLTIINSAVGGAGIGGNGEYNLPHQVMDGYTRTGGTIAPPLDATSDIVVILCGTNDYAAGQSISSVKDNLATTLQYIFEHSKAKVLLCTPLQRYNTTDQSFDTDENGVPVNSIGMTLRDLCDELIKVCRRFSVPVLDLNAEANINRYNILDYSLDGLHPDRWGDAYISRLICQKIKEMFRYELQ